MMKSEFIELIGKDIEHDDYVKVEIVYMYYPNIKDKQQIAQLYIDFGMTLIEDMLIRAEKLQQLESEETRVNQEYNRKMQEIKDKREMFMS